MQFKFKIQPYQTEAARAVTDVFAGQPNSGASPYLRDLGRAADGDGTEALPGFETQVQASEGYANAPIALGSATLLENIHKVQRRNRIVESSSLATGPAPVNLDVEMETGTGKTYVYTKTMLELNRLYGWTKFIIVVPSVAIREGVYKSLKNTEQHFFEQYGKAIRYFVYNSARLGDIDRFSASSDINVMVINMQAFNTSMKEGGRSKEARIMYSERDEFASRRPIDVIAANNPIVILDEPQKMGGNATQAGIARFRPIACLNYSATHKVTHDAVYVLDALDAFNQRLVKRIEVKGFELKNMRGTDGYLYLQDIKISKNKPPQAVIEFKKLNASGSISKRAQGFYEQDDIYPASGELEAYRDGFTVSEIVPDSDVQLGYVKFLNGIELCRGDVYGDSSDRDMRRVQIRETIKSHLEKEEALFARGIKCLSLFFIDEVAKYRVYDDDGEEGLGEQEVQRVNTLTVIASESYSDFTKSLQKDINDALRERPKAVTEEFLKGFAVQADEEKTYALTQEDAHDVYFALVQHGLIDREGVPTQKFKESGLTSVTDDDLPEHLYAYRKDIEALVMSVYDEHALDDYIRNGNEPKVRENPLTANFARAEFQELWNKINSKHSYTVDFDDEELRAKAIDRINRELFVAKASYVMTTAAQRSTQTRENLERGESFGDTTRRDYEVGEDASGVTYDLLGEVATAARITRRSAAAILKGIAPVKFRMFRDNPEEFIAKVSRCILAEKATMVVDHIAYHKLDERYDSTIFAERMPENVGRALETSRCIQDYVFWDSEGERDFARDLDSAEGKVAVYAKLPRSFKIPTPVGNYAPDWAIAFEKGSVRHVFFVAETKGSMDSLTLRDIERGKIACARKLFNEFSDEDVRYDVVHSYEDLLTVIQGTE